MMSHSRRLVFSNIQQKPLSWGLCNIDTPNDFLKAKAPAQPAIAIAASAKKMPGNYLAPTASLCAQSVQKLSQSPATFFAPLPPDKDSTDKIKESARSETNDNNLSGCLTK